MQSSTVSPGVCPRATLTVMGDTVECVVPSTQFSHCLSCKAFPSCNKPVPTVQLDQGEQFSLPSVALNCPDAHCVQTRSEVAVEDALMYSPAGHGELTGWQTLLSFCEEKSVPATHSLHVISVSASPSASLPKPTGHVDQSWHGSLPLLGLKV